MMMMDKNSDQIAELIQNWLVKKGLSGLIQQFERRERR